MEIPVQPPIQPPVQQPTPPIQQPTPPIQQPTPPIQPIPQTPPSSPKSQKGLFLPIALIILMVIFGTVVYLTTKRPNSEPSGFAEPAPKLPAVKQTDTNKDSTSLPAGTGDVQLEKDIQSIDTKIGSAESDLGSLDQGFNDQSVDLTE